MTTGAAEGSENDRGMTLLLPKANRRGVDREAGLGDADPSVDLKDLLDADLGLNRLRDPRALVITTINLISIEDDCLFFKRRAMIAL